MLRTRSFSRRRGSPRPERGHRTVNSGATVKGGSLAGTMPRQRNEWDYVLAAGRHRRATRPAVTSPNPRFFSNLAAVRTAIGITDRRCGIRPSPSLWEGGKFLHQDPARRVRQRSRDDEGARQHHDDTQGASFVKGTATHGGRQQPPIPFADTSRRPSGPASMISPHGSRLREVELSACRYRTGGFAGVTEAGHDEPLSERLVERAAGAIVSRSPGGPSGCLALGLPHKIQQLDSNGLIPPQRLSTRWPRSAETLVARIGSR